MILAPLRGVTIRCFRTAYAEAIREAGFTEAFTPFIPANRGVDPLADRELKGHAPDAVFDSPVSLRLTPQFIGKDPAALRDCLERVRAAGFATADLNCGCPFPMVRNKGRGSGILSTPSVLEKMVAVGCEVMGPGRFSVKARLGVSRNDELLKLMPMLNAHPLRFLTVHARNARQMYEGACDWTAYAAIARVAKMPLVRNGDLSLGEKGDDVMIGRSFVRHLGERADSVELLSRYVEASEAELSGERPVLGRMKEIVAYWKDLPRWRRLWPVVKISRTLGEFRQSVGL